jgi:hypothetical protein
MLREHDNVQLVTPLERSFIDYILEDIGGRDTKVTTNTPHTTHHTTPHHTPPHHTTPHNTPHNPLTTNSK